MNEIRMAEACFNSTVVTYIHNFFLLGFLECECENANIIIH